MTSLLVPFRETVYTPLPQLTLCDWRGNGSAYRVRDGTFSHRGGIACVLQFEMTRRNGSIKRTTVIKAIDRHGYAVERWWHRIHPDRTISRCALQLLRDVANR